MTTIDVIRAILLAFAGFWASYVIILPVLAAIFGGRRVSGNLRQREMNATIAVIIPSHNMSAVIERCVKALQASNYPNDKLHLYVVADHCTDDTAVIAESAGANVLVRDHGPAGKTYTLSWTLEKLADMGMAPEIYVITDATARVEPDFLNALVALYSHGEDIVVSHAVVDAENQKWFARCLGLTLVHRNFQNWARQRLRLSALIEGRGMLYSKHYVDQYGWSLALPGEQAKGSHPTEDWRHAVQAVEQGLRVAFADDARVITPLRETLGEATRQGIRWERGRMANAMTHALRLLMSGLRERSSIKVLAALDAIQPPVAILGVLCTVLFALTWFTADSPLAINLGLAPLCGFFVYGLMVVARGRKDGISPITILWAPVYLAWRFAAFVLAWRIFDRITTGSQKKA